MTPDVENLGELELAVLEYVWEHGSTDAKQAHRGVGVDRGIKHNTVQSTLKRLWEKQLLSRTKVGHAYVYDAVVDRRGITELMLDSLVDQVAGSEMGVALEAFVNLADRAGEDMLDRLEQLIAERRTERGES